MNRLIWQAWVRSIASAWLFALLATSPPIAWAQLQENSIPNLRASFDPVSPTSDFGKNDVFAKLRLVYDGSAPLQLRLEAIRLTHKNGNASGLTGIGPLGKDSLDSVLLNAKDDGRPTSQIEIPVHFSGLSYVGTYRGGVDIMLADDPTRRMHVPIEVTRQASGFSIVVSGPLVSGGVITAKPQSPDDDVFSFRVENPESGGDVNLAVTVGAIPSGKQGQLDVKIDTPAFALRPGATRDVQFSFTKKPDAENWVERTFRQSKLNDLFPGSKDALVGTFTGSLDITETSAPGLQKQLTLVVQPVYVSTSDKALLIGLVLLGTVLSLVVGSIVPTLLDRQRAWLRLRALQKPIDTCAGKGTALQIALLAHMSHLDYLAHEIWWFSPTASDKVGDLGKKIESLESVVIIISAVHSARERVRTSGKVPVSVASEIVEYLDATIRHIIAGNLALAQSSLELAQKKVDDTELLSRVQKSLTANVKRIVEDTEPGLDNKTMNSLREILKGRAPQLDGALDPDLIMRIDRECYAMHLYVERYLGDILPLRVSDERYLKAESELINHLATGLPGIWRAMDLVKSMSMGVLQDDISMAIEAKKAEIIFSPSAPSEAQLVEFRFTFFEERMNLSPLAERLTFQWDFGDATPPVSGLRCVHFFKIKDNKTFQVTVRVGNPTKDGQVVSFETSVTVTKTPRRFEVLSRAEIISTVVVSFGAVALAYLSHIADLRPLENIQDYFNPVLWGFGLDQMKALVNKSKPEGK